VSPAPPTTLALRSAPEAQEISPRRG
jgi:hypothetical protein